MRRKEALLLGALVVLSIAVSCSWVWYHLPLDCVYYLCTSVEGTVVDSATHQPLVGVTVRAYCLKHLEYSDSTDTMGTYQSGSIEQGYGSGLRKIHQLESMPPIRRTKEWRFTFNKPGYKEHQLLVPVELVYCSSHPEPAPVPQLKLPSVFLARK